MTLLVIVLVMLAAFTVVGWPLIRAAGTGQAESNGSSRLDDVIGQRDAAYGAIKELEFEYQLGNLSEPDYRGLRERYRREAAAILRELEAAMSGPDAGEVAPSDPAAPVAVASWASAEADPPCPSSGRPTEAAEE